MKTTVLFFSIATLAVSMFFSACGGGKNKEKEAQDSIRKADSLAKAGAWQDLLSASKDAKINEIPGVSVDVKKEQIRHLDKLNAFNPKAFAFDTRGKCQVGDIMVIAIGEKYNEREKSIEGKMEKVSDTKIHLFTFDKNGNFIDKLYIMNYSYETSPSGNEACITDNISKGGKLILENYSGIEKDTDFEGDKIIYELGTDGKFKEMSRKKDKHSLLGC